MLSFVFFIPSKLILNFLLQLIIHFYCCLFAQTEVEMIVLKHLPKDQTLLSSGLFPKITVMPSGALVCWTSTAWDEPEQFYLCRGSGIERVQTSPITLVGCLLGISVSNKELVALSSFDHLPLQLLNLETGEVSEAFSHPDFTPVQMCKGEEGEMFVSDMRKPAILHLDCSKEKFELVQIIPADTVVSLEMTYIPGHRLIAVNSLSLLGVKAISVETKKTVWEAKGKRAESLVYCAEFDVLLVLVSNKIVVLDVKDGSRKQVLPVPINVGWTDELCVHDKELVLIQWASNELKASFFELQWKVQQQPMPCDSCCSF